MKATTQAIESKFKVSHSMAVEICYGNLLATGKIYIHRGNYASATIASLQKKFGVELGYGNDAPRGGKNGAFRIISKTTEAFENFKNEIFAFDELVFSESQKRSEERKKAIAEMVISEEEKNKFLEKTEGLSNKRKRQIAHNFAGRKLDFYSSEGMEKFYNLSK